MNDHKTNSDTALDHDADSAFSRRGFLKGLGASLVAGAAIGCGKDEEATPEGPPTDTKPDNAGEGAAPTRTSALTQLAKDERLRFSFTDMAHFADRSVGGLLSIQMGTVAARKYINGGWRAGWSPTPRTHKGKGGESELCFEADSKTARVFFKHERGGYDRIVIRMKAVKNGNKLTAYVNDEAIKSFDIEGEWADYTIDIPKKVTKTGENQLMMRFRYDTEQDGRTQAAHVAAVHILPAGQKVEDAPRGDVLQKVSFGDVVHSALAAATPQTYTFRVDLPDDKPKLGLAWGSKSAGARFVITAVSDQTKKKTLLDETVSADKASAWNDSVLDLSDFAGQVVEFDLTATGDWKDGQFAAWGEPSIYSPHFKDDSKPASSPETPAKNLVFYLIDTLRYDKFSFYNSKTRVKTPNIDAFAADATIFDNAYDNENWTKPSTATILTGLYPETHDAKQDSSKLPRNARMVSEQLKSNGFKTAAFLANGYVSDVFGFNKGWDHYTNYIREKRSTDANHVVDEALEWIGKNKGDRFFAYLHTIDPHVPYSPPKEFREMYYKGSYDGPIRPNATGDQLAEIKTDKMKVTARDKRYLEALYDGEITFNDREFGRLIQGLKDAGLYEDTIVIIVADHGEEFWDHGKVGHGHSLYEEMIHSPMILRYPKKAARGRRIPHVVAMVDVVPTLLDLLGVEKHDDLEGVSFADTLDGDGDPHPRLAVSDFLYRKKSVRAGRYKWITIGRHGDLYDVVDDPQEKKDVIKTHHIGRAFVRGVFGLFKGANDSSKWWENTNKEAKKKVFKADAVEIDGEMQQMLEEMGYVDGAKGGPSAEEDRKRMEKEDE